MHAVPSDAHSKRGCSLRRKTVMRLLKTGIAVVALALMPAVAAAVTVVDLNNPLLGASVLVQSQQGAPSAFTSAGGTVLGTMSSSVYYNAASQVYTYVLDVTPSMTTTTQISTRFFPHLYADTAGYSLTDVVAAGATGMTLTLAGVDPTGNLKWVIAPLGTWGAGEHIRLILESLDAPGWGVNYNIGGSNTGSAAGWAPTAVPEPASLLLLGFGALSLGVGSRFMKARGWTRRAD